MITGGGTGGHTSPASAIIEALRSRVAKVDLQWVGKSGALEERVSAGLGVPFTSLPVEGWPRRGIVRRVRVLAKISMGLVKAGWLLRQFQPDAIVGVGGYVSIPLLWVAQRFAIPTILHEQNKRLGLANRLLSKRATRVLLSYPDTIGTYPADRTKLVGNPVRAGFVHPPDKTEAQNRFGLMYDTAVVLVSGGSQGARRLNEAIRDALPEVKPDEFQLLWMTGPREFETFQVAAENAPVPVKVFPFIEDMAGACAAADIVVSRAGASTTAELAAMGKPAVLVPYPYATDNHQEHNATAFEAAGAAVMIRDEECSTDRLLSVLRELLADPNGLATMGDAARTLARPRAAEAIVEEILAVVRRGEEATGE